MMGDMDKIAAVEKLPSAQDLEIVRDAFKEGFTGMEYVKSEVALWLSDSDKEPQPRIRRITRDARFVTGGQTCGVYGDTMQVEDGPVGLKHELKRTAFFCGTTAALKMKGLASRNGGEFLYTVIPEAEAYKADGLLDVEGVSVLYQTCHEPHTVSWAFAAVKED